MCRRLWCRLAPASPTGGSCECSAEGVVGCGVVYAPHLGNPSPLGSIMGEGAEVGIVPRFSQELFDRVEGSVHQQVREKYIPAAVKVFFGLVPSMGAMYTHVHPS